MEIVKYGKGEKWPEYRKIESLFDMGDERFVIFKQYLLQVFEQIDNPLWSNCFAKCKAHWNDSNHAEVMIEMINFDKAIMLKEINYDAYSMCFALLHLQEGEEQSHHSASVQEKKLEKMRKAGITRGQVEETVINFLKASPRQFGAYLAVLKEIQAQVEN